MFYFKKIFFRNLPPRSSPYRGISAPTPAIEQLRQYAGVDGHREALSGGIPHSQAHFPYHMSAVSIGNVEVVHRLFLCCIFVLPRDSGV